MNTMFQPLGYKSHQPHTSLVPSIARIPHTPYAHMEQSEWSANPPHYLKPQKPAQALAPTSLGGWKCIDPSLFEPVHLIILSKLSISETHR